MNYNDDCWLTYPTLSTSGCRFWTAEQCTLMKPQQETQWDTSCRCSFCRILSLPLRKESQKPYTQATTFSVRKKQTLRGIEKQELVILSRKQIVINTCISTQKHFILRVLEKAWQIWTLVRHKLKKAKRFKRDFTHIHEHSQCLKDLVLHFCISKIIKSRYRITPLASGS